VSRALPWLLTVLVVILGSSLGWQLTQGLQAFTWETQRRIQIEKNPIALPNIVLENQRGEFLDLESLDGKVLAVNFIYTRCPTICGFAGVRFAQLQAQIEERGYQDKVLLLSISLDPGFDTPKQLQAYQHRFSKREISWQVVRPVNISQAQLLLDIMRVVSIDDGQGGIIHNAATHIIDQSGRLVRVIDEDKVGKSFALIESMILQDKDTVNDG
jgi:protein SCO1/2